MSLSLFTKFAREKVSAGLPIVTSENRAAVADLVASCVEQGHPRATRFILGLPGVSDEILVVQTARELVAADRFVALDALFPGARVSTEWLKATVDSTDRLGRVLDKYEDRVDLVDLSAHLVSTGNETAIRFLVDQRGSTEVLNSQNFCAAADAESLLRYFSEKGCDGIKDVCAQFLVAGKAHRAEQVLGMYPVAKFEELCREMLAGDRFWAEAAHLVMTRKVLGLTREFLVDLSDEAFAASFRAAIRAQKFRAEEFAEHVRARKLTRKSIYIFCEYAKANGEATIDNLVAAQATCGAGGLLVFLHWAKFNRIPRELARLVKEFLY